MSDGMDLSTLFGLLYIRPERVNSVLITGVKCGNAYGVADRLLTYGTTPICVIMRLELSKRKRKWIATRNLNDVGMHEYIASASGHHPQVTSQCNEATKNIVRDEVIRSVGEWAELNLPALIDAERAHLMEQTAIAGDALNVAEAVMRKAKSDLKTAGSRLKDFAKVYPQFPPSRS